MREPSPWRSNSRFTLRVLLPPSDFGFLPSFVIRHSDFSSRSLDTRPFPLYPPPVIRNVIFDWSGTLVDDLPAVWKATNYVLAQAERAEMSLEQFRAEFCLPFTIFYDRHVPHVPLPQLETWFLSQFRQVQDSVCELPHAREFLEFCRARDF